MCATSVCSCDDVPPKISQVRTGGHPMHIPRPTYDKNMTAPWQKTLITSIKSKFTIPNGKIKTILESSQPVHALAVIAVAIVYTSLFHTPTSSPKPYSSTTTLIYLLSFALHFGSQFWMTFVSGLSLYFSLPRHAFGDVQVVLFPKYFTLNSILSAVSLLTFSKLHSHLEWEAKHWIQMGALSTCFLLEAFSRLYIAPGVCHLIHLKKNIEVTEPGVGSEVGSYEPGRLRHCPHYMSLQSAFRKLHSVMAIANILSMICTITQLVHISQSLCLN